MRFVSLASLAVAFYLVGAGASSNAEVAKPGSVEPPDIQSSSIDQYNNTHAIDPKSRVPSVIEPTSRATDRDGQAGGAQPAASQPEGTDEGAKRRYQESVQRELAEWDAKIAQLSQNNPANANLSLSVANNLDLRRLQVQNDLEELQKTEAGSRDWPSIRDRIQNKFVLMQSEYRKATSAAE